MKRYKTAIILAGVLAVLCLLAVIIIKTEEKKEEIRNTEEVILDIDPSKVENLSWNYSETSLSFRKEEEQWLYEEDEAFPVDDSKIEKLLRVFSGLTASFIIEKPEDPEQYGLTDPVCTIQIGTEESSYEILLGAYSTIDSKRYLSFGDGNVYLVSTDPMTSYETELKSLILHDTVPNFEQIDRILFTGAESYEILPDETEGNSICDSDIYYTTVQKKKVPLDTSLVEDYVSTVSYLNLATYVSYNVSEEELTAFGFDEPVLQIDVDYTQTDTEGTEHSDSVTLYVAQNREERKAEEEAEAKGEEYSGVVTSYARVGESRIIYQITSAAFDDLMKYTYNDLRHQEVFTGDPDLLTGISVNLEGEDYEITSEEDKENEGSLIYLYDSEEVDLYELESCLAALNITEFNEEAEEGQLEIRLLLQMDHEYFPETELELYRYDGNTCVAELNGEILGFVSRASVVDLQEAVRKIILK